ncbi:MAG: hypothetical protein WBM84_13990 [Sedimenticolaceae bacterium]
MLDVIMDAGFEVHANKTLTVLKMLFNQAYDHDKITDVPTDRIKPPGAVTPRERTLTTPELVAVWNATYGDGGIDSHLHGDIVRILMLTGQRRNKVAGAKSPGCNGRRSISSAASGNSRAIEPRTNSRTSSRGRRPSSRSCTAS